MSSVSGLTAENYGSGDPSDYYALADYLNFVFVRTGNTIASFQLSTLGQTIESYSDTLRILNDTYQYATNTDVELDMDGDTDVDASDANISSSDYIAIEDGIVAGYADLTGLIDGGTVTGDTLGYLQDVQSDLEHYSTMITYVDDDYDLYDTEQYTPDLGWSQEEFDEYEAKVEQYEADLANPEITFTDNSDGTTTVVYNVDGNTTVGEMSQSQYYLWYQDTTVQQNLENALAAVESVGLEQQEKLKQANYIYEQYVKGSSSLLSTIDQIFQTMTAGMRS
jgi:hypothetical protein